MKLINKRDFAIIAQGTHLHVVRNVVGDNRDDFNANYLGRVNFALCGILQDGQELNDFIDKYYKDRLENPKEKVRARFI